MAYPTVDPYPRRRPACPPSRRSPTLENAVLEYWDGRPHLPRQCRQPAGRRERRNEFVFYDGPPFANGLPHYGHLLTGYVKDVVPRYQTMRGKRVERRFGWDSHGLPAEVEAEKQLGIKAKAEISSTGHRQVQRRLPRVRAALHRRVAATTSPGRPAGSTSTTTTRRSTSTTWKASCGRSRPCGTRA